MKTKERKRKIRKRLVKKRRKDHQERGGRRERIR